jgi:uncharacterized membrane protein
MGWNEYWHAPWMFFGPMMMTVFVLVCVAVTSFVMRDRATHRSGATEILKERCARGEITQAEFEERRRLLDA